MTVSLKSINYYSIAVLACVGVFFFVMSLTNDGLEENSWLAAVVAALGTGLSMVLFRQIVLRRVREKELAARRLSHHIRIAGSHFRPTPSKKMTVERNDELVAEIRKRSDAAKVLGKVADAHKDIFELCEAYLKIASSEIARARTGSPRLPAIRNGASFAARRHKYHILKWAEIKARSAQLDMGSMAVKDRLVAAEAALEAVDRALAHYPNEMALTESRRVLAAFFATGTIKSIIDEAEQAEKSGNIEAAVAVLRRAMESVHEGGIHFTDNPALRGRFEEELRRLEAKLRK